MKQTKQGPVIRRLSR
ncbi:hypothetical protein MAR_001221 [Mya arenaria]|uniref:Uncharacterized protein n=1 Tax=Mya arenaria TaxID=6604 RepID=A0ABY7FB33_MYAAR|nr:hypothetical protein MAR_001221 [Mya arenaria]